MESRIIAPARGSEPTGQSERRLWGGEQKTARCLERAEPAIEPDQAGVWHVRAFREARAILRSSAVRQAGFKAEVLARLPRLMRLPLLYSEGQEHQQQRRQTARFFAPRVVNEQYRKLMEAVSEQLIEKLRRRKKIDLSRLTLEMAVRIAAEVVGLTDSWLPGMASRLEAFFRYPIQRLGPDPRTWLNFLGLQWAVLRFYWLDVRPAIRARRRQPRQDVISHLLAQGYSAREILTECVTYGAAGMITTREFIGVAAWHLLEQPALRQRFLQAPEEERLALLEEVLRLEPVVGHLYRRTSRELVLAGPAEEQLRIPAGAMIDLHIYAINGDERVVGEQPRRLGPGRTLHEERVPSSLMGFGDGAHRCPGAPIALQESDIFLRRLLALPGLRLERPPRLRWNELICGYELRDLIVSLDESGSRLQEASPASGVITPSGTAEP
ncbi:cytochrome P450 [Thermogemmatispora carboxidivorans]|uniref:cytochrome P450 n=1 Tax=Thermogemmatispora carboxidivorans TaxID=1382306 RepID=UPI0009E04C70|nr:cytochrome P450 [Thermogemmatispora carboxidivorans]